MSPLPRLRHAAIYFAKLTFMNILFSLLALLVGLPGMALAGAVTIMPGAVWPDDRGQHVQAHGGGITKVGDTWYWFGEDRGRTNAPGRRYVGCYASHDLAYWTFRHQVVQAEDPAGLGPGWILERPKVYHNELTHQFVMYAHIDDRAYKVASVAVFTCATVDGDYQYVKRFRPLGHESRDIGQFVDDDGTAYLIFEDRPFGFRIARLAADYLSVESEMCLVPKHMEGGAVFRLNGLYYVLGSNLTGWNPNPNTYATATSLRGPWSEFKDLAPHALNTYGAQSTLAVKITGSAATNVIFMGDIWRPRSQWDSRYLWMPLQIDGAKVALPPPAPWTLDVATGMVKNLKFQNSKILKGDILLGMKEKTVQGGRD